MIVMFFYKKNNVEYIEIISVQTHLLQRLIMFPAFFQNPFSARDILPEIQGLSGSKFDCYSPDIAFCPRKANTKLCGFLFLYFRF